MKKSLSFTDIILYLISTFVILGMSIFLSVFFQTESQIYFDSASYGAFLNTIYISRLYYCLYEETKNPYILFYFPRDIEKINSYSSLEKCFSTISINYKDLFENQSSDNKIILKYNIRNLSEVPIFLFYNVKNKSKIWVKDQAKQLFFDEQKDIWSTFLDIIFPIPKIIDTINKFTTKIELESNPENLIKCDSDKSYYISSIFTLPFLSIDTKRNLYSVNVYKFIRVRGKECKKVTYISNIDPNTGKRNLEVVQETC